MVQSRYWRSKRLASTAALLRRDNSPKRQGDAALLQQSTQQHEMTLLRYDESTQKHSTITVMLLGHDNAHSGTQQAQRCWSDAVIVCQTMSAVDAAQPQLSVQSKAVPQAPSLGAVKVEAWLCFTCRHHVMAIITWAVCPVSTSRHHFCRLCHVTNTSGCHSQATSSIWCFVHPSSAILPIHTNCCFKRCTQFEGSVYAQQHDLTSQALMRFY